MLAQNVYVSMSHVRYNFKWVLLVRSEYYVWYVSSVKLIM